jgi:hypothetical protein
MQVIITARYPLPSCAAAVARSLTVLADDYDELCARLSQFNFWIRYRSNSAKFSQSGLIELGRFYERVQSFPANNQMSTRQQGMLGLYQSDPEASAAEQRIAASTYSMQKLMELAKAGSRKLPAE